MARQNQYRKLMLIFKEFRTMDTDKAQEEYRGRHGKAIQIGTRINYLERSGYLVKFDEKYKLKQYSLSLKGIERKDTDPIVIKRSTKEERPRSSQEESIVKKECKTITTLIEKEAPPIEPTTLRQNILSLFK